MTTGALVDLSDICKSYGAVQALDGADLSVTPGEVVGVVGHNGAGKSTLMGVLAGTVAADRGTIVVGDTNATRGYGVRTASTLGIRCIFQELSLCPNLRVYENVRVMHPRIRGFGWRRRAKRLIGEMLDAIFPGHGIDPSALTSRLSISQRQMVETARAFTVTDTPLRAIILDEPTASLSTEVAEQLMAYIRRAADDGIGCLLVSHRLSEVLGNTDRTVVMRDGTVVADSASSGLDMQQLLTSMGVEDSVKRANRSGTAKAFGSETLRVKAPVQHSTVEAHAGEVIGLAGLAGHGQQDLLRDIFASGRASGRGGRGGASVHGTLAYVSGDRESEGVFPLWTVGQNLTVSLLGRLTRAGLLSNSKQQKTAEQWRNKFDIRTPHVKHPITNLSGGNQQKVLIARAFATEAQIVLFDDPLRGVDVGTKNELFQHVRAAADAGHTFLWYTTENTELYQCDRIYVFYDFGISDCIERADLSEQRLLASSFARTPHATTVADAH